MTPQTPDMQAVLERLEKLEKQNRRLKQAGVVGLLAVGALVLTGQAAPKGRTLEAERFILKDATGRVRAALVIEASEPSLRLFDANGATMATLSATAQGAVLSLHDPNGSAGISLGVSDYGRGLTLYDANRQQRAEFILEREGARLTLRRATGEPVASLDGAGELGLTLHDATGRKRIVLALWTPRRASALYRGCGKRDAGPDRTGGRSTLTFYDAEGDCEYSAP